MSSRIKNHDTEPISDLVSSMIENIESDFDSDYELEQEFFNSSIIAKSKIENKRATSNAIDIAKQPIEKSVSMQEKEILAKEILEGMKNEIVNKEMNKKEMNKKEMKKNSPKKCCSACRKEIVTFLKLIIIIAFGFLIVISLLDNFHKDTIKNHRFHKSLRNKLCDNSVFIRKHFNDQDSCCQQLYDSICYKSEIGDIKIEDKCKNYDSFKPFIQYCIYKIELADYYDLIEDMFYP